MHATKLLLTFVCAVTIASNTEAQVRSMAGLTLPSTPFTDTMRHGMLDSISNPKMHIIIRSILAGRLLADSAGADQVIPLVEKNPDAHLRASAIRGKSRSVAGRTNPKVREMIQRMATSDPDVGVAMTAINELRAFTLLDMQSLINAQYEKAQSAGDTARMRTALNMQEDLILSQRDIYLPRFMRQPPPLFNAAPGAVNRVRVLAFGDFGTGSKEQKQVAAAIRKYHAKKPFNLGITLGDNFYDNGLNTPTHKRWQADYEALYSPMGIKIYPSFGNHDWNDSDAPAAEIMHTSYSKTWEFPAQYYTFTAGPVQFYAIDTNELSEKQLAWLEAELMKSKATWKVVYGHHPPYVASKNKDQDPRLLKVLWPILKKGQVDAYFCGHNHSMQQLKPIEGITVFINGAGGRSLYQIDADDPQGYFLAQMHGFTVIDADAKKMFVRFINVDGIELHAGELTK